MKHRSPLPFLSPFFCFITPVVAASTDMNETHLITGQQKLLFSPVKFSIVIE